MAITYNGRSLGKAHDISIAVAFEDDSMAEFGAHSASKTPFKAHGFVGDVREGGSCNCDMITFSPHLHGTHTECVGHIVADKVTVHEVLKDAFIPAQLVHIAPQRSADCDESYVPDLRPDDLLITKAALENAVAHKNIPEALIIRTGWEKNAGLPPFFSLEAMEYIVTQDVQHLLVDVPSIDRMDDDGHLAVHHIFWGVEQGHHTLSGNKPSTKTVTELIHVPESLKPGNYLLNLQVAAFAADSAPSRPLLYELD
ncbi:MAG: cyclase family protein [Alphaproteobacteria bacterium]